MDAEIRPIPNGSSTAGVDRGTVRPVGVDQGSGSGVPAALTLVKIG
ncbi:hypothetical protein ATKI12_4624 [Kitasatospora sp. Ki12]